MAADSEPKRDPDTFLARWSKRKTEARREDDPADKPPAPADATDVEPPPPLELPDLESLGPGADFKPFMQRGVPAELRNAALRKLWRSRPGLANLDGLVDYGEDFTDAARAVPMLKTAYEVGRGFLKPEPTPTEPTPAETPKNEPQAEVAEADTADADPASEAETAETPSRQG